MVIDSSAIAAIFFEETEWRQFLEAIATAETRLISAANLVEAAIVIENRLGDAGARDLDLFVIRASIEVVAVDTDQATLARYAWRKFGKGRHPAALNFGDCFAYALAKSNGEPLLAKGNDFRLTDIKIQQ
jgi:ribonuclease VapC